MRQKIYFSRAQMNVKLHIHTYVHLLRLAGYALHNKGNHLLSGCAKQEIFLNVNGLQNSAFVPIT
jgi:hypothetical protein